MKAREGDLIKTKSCVVFDVKGLVHPLDKIVAFPRFIPSPQGTRQGKECTYGKVYSLRDRFKYLQKNFPDLVVFDAVFGETMCEVPVDQVAQHYKPEEKLWTLRTSKDLTILENKALHLAETLKKEADIPWSNIGISGSIMAGLTTEKSDIDPLVYGEKNCRKANAALKTLFGDGRSGFKSYSETAAAGAVRFPFEGHSNEFRRLRFGRKPQSVPGQVHGHRLLHPLREGLARNQRAIRRRVLQKQWLRKNNRQNSRQHRLTFHTLHLQAARHRSC